MGDEIRVTDASQLDRVNEIVHDHWFSLEDIGFDETTSKLRIRFSRPQLHPDRKVTGRALLGKVDIPYVECFLRIEHVRSWHLEDTQHIGRYDFNVVSFDEAMQRVRVTTGVPLILHADVEALDVSVVVSDVVVKTEKRLGFLA